MTDWPATVAPKWVIARNHAATVEEDVIREAPVVPTGGQAGRWQTITDTTTIESSLVDLKEKEATPQDRRSLYVDCIKRTTTALGVGVETIEPDHHLLNHLVTSSVAQVERAASVCSRAGIAVGNPDVVRLPASCRSTGRRQMGSHERLRGSTIGEGGDTTISYPGRSSKQPLPRIGLHNPLHRRQACPDFIAFDQGVVKYVPGRRWFHAVSSQKGDKYVISPPPPIVERVVSRKRGQGRTPRRGTGD